jgi:small GTP-binding protein
LRNGIIVFSLQGGAQATARKKVVFLGLDNAGKSSIVHALIGGSPHIVAPTHGFNSREFEFENTTLDILDVGGQKSLRHHWTDYLVGAGGIVWVIDSADQRRMYETGLELAALLRDEEAPRIPILFLANKQDLSIALSPADVRIIF